MARPLPEVRLATGAAVMCLLLTPLAALVGWLIAGPPGGIGAAYGVVTVALLAVAGLPLHHWAGRRSIRVVAAAACGGLGLRFAVAVVLLTAGTRIPGVSVTSIAVGLVVALVGATAAEMRLAARDPRLSFIDASLARTPTERTPA